MVHIPAGDYSITSTLTIPANTDIQLVGDGYRTRLLGKGLRAAPVLLLQGPSKATIRELNVDGGNTTEGIVARNIDQQGSRVFIHGGMLAGGTKTNLFADGLDFTSIDAEDLGHENQNTGSSIKLVGGRLAAAGDQRTGAVNIYSGASSGELLPYDVSTLLVRDVWYEFKSVPGVLPLCREDQCDFRRPADRTWGQQ